MIEIFEEKSAYCEVKAINNNIQITIDEGKKQLSNYWIAKVESDPFGEATITGDFVSAKTNGKVKTFVNIEDGDYVIQLGKSTSKDTSRRVSFSIYDGDIVYEK